MKFLRTNKISGFILIMIFMALVNTSCMAPGAQNQVEKPAPGPPLKIICSFLPVYIFTSNLIVTRSNISLSMIVPHDFKNNPSNYNIPEGTDLSADILIANGLGIDSNIIDAATKANPKIRVIDTSVGIERIEVISGAETEKSNPFTWLSPKCAITQVKNIEKALIESDPNGEKEIKSRTEKFIKMLEDLEKSIDNSNPKSKGITFGSAEGIFNYLLRDFGLTAINNAGTDNSIGNDNIGNISKEMKEKGVSVILLRSSLEEKELIKNSNLPVVFLDPLFSGSTFPDSYEKTMKKNINNLKKVITSQGK